MYSELGIDISRWQSRIDGQILKDAGVRCVIAKMGQGLTLDKMFPKHIEEALKYGLIAMAYWWDDIIVTSARQVDVISKALDDYDLPISCVAADQEQWWTNWYAWEKARAGKIYWSEVPYGSQDNISIHNEAFMRKLRAWSSSSGTPIIGYWSYGFQTTWAKGMKNWIGAYDTWVPYWPKKIPGGAMTWAKFKEVVVPPPETEILMVPPGHGALRGWQFTGDRYLLPGVYQAAGLGREALSPLDVSVFDPEWLYALPNIGNYTPPVIVPDQPSKYVVVLDNLWILSGPGNNYKATGKLRKDSIVFATTIIDGKYAKLVDGGYVHYSGLRLVS